MLRNLRVFLLKLSGVEKFYAAPDGSIFYPKKKATQEQIESAENELGFELPKALKNILLDVGDGGFGPGYGLMCLKDIIDTYDFYREPDANELEVYPWPKGIIPILTTGCGLYYCVSSLENGNPVYSTGDHCYDNDAAEGTLESILELEKPSLGGWIASWK